MKFVEKKMHLEEEMSKKVEEEVSFTLCHTCYNNVLAISSRTVPKSQPENVDCLKSKIISTKSRRMFTRE